MWSSRKLDSAELSAKHGSPITAYTDLAKMLAEHGDWVALGSADEQKPAADGTVEARPATEVKQAKERQESQKESKKSACEEQSKECRDALRRLRDDALSDIALAPSGVVWETARFEPSPGEAFSMRTNMIDTLIHVRAAKELLVLFGPKRPSFAVIVAPSLKTSIGLPRKL